ncbi:hypothetical protein [Vibrio sp. H11]|uniref:hypothetical protein n=1 Tax=Vibrio sp. H11 TaxID=2565928 RepID=UPI001455EDC2|nr:hypothetical protein [Vibrio sp. H11]
MLPQSADITTNRSLSSPRFVIKVTTKRRWGIHNVTFSDWIENEFGKRGIAQAAQFLGVPYKTAYSWATLDRFPRLREQELITLKSNGAVNINDWRRQHLNHQQQKRATA